MSLTATGTACLHSCDVLRRTWALGGPPPYAGHRRQVCGQAPMAWPRWLVTAERFALPPSTACQFVLGSGEREFSAATSAEGSSWTQWRKRSLKQAPPALRHFLLLLAVCITAIVWRITSLAPMSLELSEHRQSSYMPRWCRWRHRTAPRRAPGRAGTRSSTRATGSSRSARRRGARRAAGSPAARRPRRRRPTRPTAVSFAQGAHYRRYLEAVSAVHRGLGRAWQVPTAKRRWQSLQGSVEGRTDGTGF